METAKYSQLTEQKKFMQHGTRLVSCCQLHWHRNLPGPVIGTWECSIYDSKCHRTGRVADTVPVSNCLARCQQINAEKPRRVAA